MKTVYLRACAAALALVIAASVPAPAFARNRDESRDLTDRAIRIIKKIRAAVGLGTNSDGITPPKP